MIPRAWTLASPEQVLAARLDAARASLTRLLGNEVANSAEVAELADLLRQACEVLTPEGRPLYAGHADLTGAWKLNPELTQRPDRENDQVSPGRRGGGGGRGRSHDVG